MISIGKIVGTHGVRGTAKILSYAESLSFFSPDHRMRSKKKDGGVEVLTVRWAKQHKNVVLVCFEEIDSIDKCREFIGASLLIERDRLPETETGVYYWADLIGLSVYTTEDSYLGRLNKIFTTGSNDVYVVNEKEAEILIPALESVVKEIDLSNKIMRVEIPEGL